MGHGKPAARPVSTNPIKANCGDRGLWLVVPRKPRQGALFARELSHKGTLGNRPLRRRNSRQVAAGNSFSIAAMTRDSVGSTAEANAAAISPSRPTRYL